MSEFTPFIYGEAMLAEAMGVTLKALHQLRKEHLKRGSEWDMAGAVVAYSEAGFETLAIGLGLAQKNAAGALEGVDGVDVAGLREKTRLPGTTAQKKTAPEGQPVQAKITRFTMNRHMMLAVIDGDTSPVNVRVTKRDNFRIGMQIPIVPGKENPLVYELARKLPRAPGRW